MNKSSDLYDITIVGGGPTGLFAAFYAGMRELKTKIIEALPELGGQLSVLYPEKYIYDVPGFPKILSKELVKNLIEQAMTANPTLCLEERALTLRRREDGILELETTKGLHISRTVLIAAGVGAFSPNKLSIPDAEKFEGRGVFYFVREKALLKGKKILIVGGGDSAVDWALNLKDEAEKVTLVHRRDVFRAHESSVKQLFHAGIDIFLFWEVKELHGNERLEEALIFNNKTRETKVLPVDVVLINIGFKADPGPIRNWPVEFEGRHIKINGRMETSLPGVYAAGDIAHDPASVYFDLIVIGYAQAAVAVNCAANYINPKATLFPGHSSERSS